jgi:hypothetical protein
MAQIGCTGTRVETLLAEAGPAAEQDAVVARGLLEQLRRVVKDVGWDRLNLRADHLRRRRY